MGFLGGLGGQESPSLRLLRLQCQAGRQPTADKCITFVKIVITWNESHYASARGALQRTINIMIENVFTQVYSITKYVKHKLSKEQQALYLCKTHKLYLVCGNGKICECLFLF